MTSMYFSNCFGLCIWRISTMAQMSQHVPHYHVWITFSVTRTNYKSHHLKLHRSLCSWYYLLSFRFKSAFLPVDFPNFTFSQKWICFSCDLELWPMTLAYESDLYRDKMNYHAKYQRHKSFHLKVIVQTHTHTHSCLTQLHDDKVISNEQP